MCAVAAPINIGRIIYGIFSISRDVGAQWHANAKSCVTDLVFWM